MYYRVLSIQNKKINYITHILGSASTWENHKSIFFKFIVFCTLDRMAYTFSKTFVICFVIIFFLFDIYLFIYYVILNQ